MGPLAFLLGVPLAAGLALTLIGDYRLGARINVAASAATFLAGVSLFWLRPAPGLLLLVDDVNITFLVLTTFVTMTTAAFSAGYIGHELEIAFAGAGSDFVVEVSDTGVGVDPRHVPKVDLVRYANERRTGGLGLHLMGKIMDSVTFSRAAGRNVCSLSKRRPDPDAAAR